MHKTGLVPTQFPNGIINFRALRQWGGFSAKEGSISPSSLVSSFVSFFACFNAVGQERFLAIILVKIIRSIIRIWRYYQTDLGKSDLSLESMSV